MARRADEHDYRECREDDCPLYPCKVYKEGRRDGYAADAADGEISGYVDGYAAGAAAAARGA